jgi:tetratricopeptide (TPR) repeat protein
MGVKTSRRSVAAATIVAMTLAVAVLAVRPRSAVADLDPDTIPGKWIAPMVPEHLPEPTYAPYDQDDPLAKARDQAFSGRYRLALVTLEDVTAGDATERLLIRAQCLAATGRSQEAIDALASNDDATRAADVRVMTLRGQTLADMGQLTEAATVLAADVAAHPNSIAAHYWLANVHERMDDIPRARAEYSWFIDKPQAFLDALKTNPRRFTDAAELTLIARAADRWAAISGAYQTNDSLHNTILNLFVRAYDVIDRQYWPAHVAAAEYFRSHDDDEHAMKELQAAITGNPNSIEAWVVRGKIALASFDFDSADQVISAIRQVDPHSIQADMLEARNLLQQRVPKEAMVSIQAALAQQPRNVEALGLLAATDALMLHDDQTAAVLKQVDDWYPTDALAYFEVAEQLAALRQYPRSAAMYKIAIQRAPWWTDAQNGLGLLYTQSGDEDLSRGVLEAAHVLDPFNVATTNYLKLLDEMATFTRKESAHFIVLYDASKDPIIPEYFNDYMESIYQDVCSNFQCEPKVKTIIEVFPTHESFSVRTTGSPWIGTVGASTGRVIAIVAPRSGQNTLGPFNWTQVLRHEFTHTVTLAATDNRITHWMTEGLAVGEERSPMRWEWVPMLYTAVHDNALFSMDNLTWGFVRPKEPGDRQLAYAQSMWICQYIEEKHGHEAILKLLEQFRLGFSQDDAFPTVLGRTLPQFSVDFFAWAQKQVASWGYDEKTTGDYETLKMMAQAQDQAGQYKDEAQTWEAAVTLRPMDILPHQKLAGLYMRRVPDADRSAEELETLARVELKDDSYAKGVARRYSDLGELQKAVKYAEKAVYTNPYDPVAHDLLEQLYEKTNNAAGMEREKRVIPILNKWIEDQKKIDPFAPAGR